MQVQRRCFSMSALLESWLYTCIKDKVAPTIAEILSMILAIGGTFNCDSRSNGSALYDTSRSLWGLFSALTYALYIILPIKLIQKWGSILVIGVGMTISGFVAVPFTGIIGASISMSLISY